ncbi:hypothetical protein A3A99_03870 [Candidatus Nomurabacteria bacterium RIFCSPLOWO2_01_FULL_41_18]|nr:MAG: hypothetical protein A3A99_03870 [Candidatus Nomurabacteria bacterium RIFCSPLOWO2_01_FULL_41_18]
MWKRKLWSNIIPYSFFPKGFFLLKKERLREIADPPRTRALKMDGVKFPADTLEFFFLRKEKLVGRRSARAEASS